MPELTLRCDQCGESFNICSEASGVTVAHLPGLLSEARGPFGPRHVITEWNYGEVQDSHGAVLTDRESIVAGLDALSAVVARVEELYP